MYLLLHDMIYINCMHDMISIYIAWIICYYAITQYMSFFLIRVPEKNCYTKIKKTTFLKKMYNFGLIRLSWYLHCSLVEVLLLDEVVGSLACAV